MVQYLALSGTFNYELVKYSTAHLIGVESGLATNGNPRISSYSEVPANKQTNQQTNNKNTT